MYERNCSFIIHLFFNRNYPHIWIFYLEFDYNILYDSSTTVIRPISVRVDSFYLIHHYCMPVGHSLHSQQNEKCL